MSDIERELSKKIETMFMEAMLGGPHKKQPQTAIRLRGNGFETVDLDDAGNVIEPLRCTCGVLCAMHQPRCPFYCLTT